MHGLKNKTKRLWWRLCNVRNEINFCIPTALSNSINHLTSRPGLLLCSVAVYKFISQREVAIIPTNIRPVILSTSHYPVGTAWAFSEEEVKEHRSAKGAIYTMFVSGASIEDDHTKIRLLLHTMEGNRFLSIARF